MILVVFLLLLFLYFFILVNNIVIYWNNITNNEDSLNGLKQMSRCELLWFNRIAILTRYIKFKFGVWKSSAHVLISFFTTYKFSFFICFWISTLFDSILYFIVLIYFMFYTLLVISKSRHSATVVVLSGYCYCCTINSYCCITW